MSSSAVFFVFAAVFASAWSQCSLEGSSYSVENTTITFGAAVGEWIPAVEYWDDQGTPQAWFMTWRQATVSRWEVQDWGSSGRWEACPQDTIGQYKVDISEDCNGFSVTLIYDECESRSTFFSNIALSLVDSVVPDGQCSVWEGSLQTTEESPALSGEAATIYPALGGFVIVSIGDYTAIFQEWSRRPEDPANFHIIKDLVSVPEGYACEERFYGQYFLTTANGCGASLCGQADSCAARAGLFHGVSFNDYNGAECANPIHVITYPNNGCSDGTPWKKHPYDCVDQFNGDQCLYCHGVANGLDVKLCLERSGGGCNDIFRSLPAKGWCNLEFECPASTISLSVIAVFSVVLALLFQ